MHRLITISPEDLQQALLKGANLDAVAARLRRNLKIPAAAKTEGLSVLTHLQQAPLLHALTDGWLQGTPCPLTGRIVKRPAFHLLPFCPQENAHGYLRPLLKNIRPSVIALDASAFETAAALQYACSLYFALGIAGRSVLNDQPGKPGRGGAHGTG